jgi:hypothetical protein
MSAHQTTLLPRASPAGFRLLEWRAFTGNSGTLLGHATVELPSGMIISDIPAFRRDDGSLSAGVPSKPLVDAEGHQLRDPAGRRRYSPTLGFTNPAVKTRWSAAIVALLEAEGISASE